MREKVKAGAVKKWEPETGNGEKKKKSPLSSSPFPVPQSLLRWYDQNRRVMPWRALPGQAVDPYRVWLSEIMLQQTTVATVAPYFQKFMRRWPTVRDLATADIDDVMRLWAGLGYYRRARMAHRCAQIVHQNYGDVFPRDEKSLRALPGVGDYTAAALRAIAFDQPANVVDGNVERVMARIFAIRDPLPAAKAKIRQAAAILAPQKRCGDYAQALMDLGATVCTPRAPKCDLCPWRGSCAARSLGIEQTLPRRLKAKTKPMRRAIAFVLFNNKGEVFIRRRPPHGLLGGMMEVPSSPWRSGDMPSLAAAKKYLPNRDFSDRSWVLCRGCVTHVFTHFTVEIAVAVARVGAAKGQFIAPTRLKDEALPSVMKKIIHHALKSV